MAGEDGRGWRSCQTVAVILALCSLVPSLTCFSLRGLSKNVKQDKVVSEATVTEARTGSILFNGKELDSLSGSASAAGNGLLNVDLDQSNGAEMLEQTSQLEEAMANEIAWRRLQPSLYCGQNKMKLKAMGPRAADLKLDMGNAHSLPLIKVPETCRYSVKQNAMGLILVVSYNGCNVIQENGNYVLQMRWRETPVKFTCPMLTSSATAAPKPAQEPWKLPLPHGLGSRNRRKRQTNQPLSIYDPRSPYHYLLYYYYYYYYYYMHMMTLAPTPGTATTTAQPNTTMTTTEEPPQTSPPAYPYYPYHYPYYPYYYPLPNVPVTTMTPPVTTSGMTTEMNTTAPASNATDSASTTTAPASNTTDTVSTTTAPASTTTDSASTTTASTTKVPQQPQYPYHPLYPYFPYYPGGQQLPDNDIYYYQIIQNYYGKTPHPHISTIPTTTNITTQPPTVTTAEPGQSTTTAKPSDSSTVTQTTTSASAPTTTRVCSHATEPYPGQMGAFASFYDSPFTPQVSFKSDNAGQLPGNQKYIPQSGYKYGLQARGHPPPHPGFHYWQPALGFPDPTGKDHPQFDWRNLLPKHV